MLLPNHQKMLSDSAITPEVAADRGYFSATQHAELENLGFRSYQISLPALVVPIHDVTGTISLHQIRPDTSYHLRLVILKMGRTLFGQAVSSVS